MSSGYLHGILFLRFASSYVETADHGEKGGRGAGQLHTHKHTQCMHTHAHTHGEAIGYEPVSLRDKQTVKSLQK